MKSKKQKKVLTVKRETISHLNHASMNNVNGGAIGPAIKTITCDCVPTNTTTTIPISEISCFCPIESEMICMPS